MFPAASMAPTGSSFAAFEPKVSLPGGGVGCGDAGESKTPLKTARLTNGPGGTTAMVDPGPKAAQTFGILPKGGLSLFVLMFEAVKTPYTMCVALSIKGGPRFVFGNVVPGGRINSGSVMPLAGGDHAESLTEAE